MMDSWETGVSFLTRARARHARTAACAVPRSEGAPWTSCAPADRDSQTTAAGLTSIPAPARFVATEALVILTLWRVTFAAAHLDG